MESTLKEYQRLKKVAAQNIFWQEKTPGETEAKYKAAVARQDLRTKTPTWRDFLKK